MTVADEPRAFSDQMEPFDRGEFVPQQGVFRNAMRRIV